jgi:hypothetical protein
MRNTIVVGMGVIASIVCAQSMAAAQETVCTTAPAGWNVPNGDTVYVSGPSPVYAVLSAVGEYRSHSMLSNGPDSWVTHATSVTPPINTDESPYWTPFCSSCGSECWNPINPSFLYNSMPGLETTNQGGIYAFLYNGGSANLSNGSGPGENFIAYQRTYNASSGAWNDGISTNVSNASFGSGPGGSFGLSWSDWYSGTGLGANNNASSSITSTNSNYLVYGHAYNGSQIHYGWYQYKNVQGTPTGTPGVNTGVVCSSSLAMWNYEAGYGQVAARTYLNGAINTGANALWNAVQSECSATTGWFSSVGSFFTNLGWTALCAGATGLGQGVCGQAADQMVNCFAANNCGNTGSPGNYWGSYTAHDDGQTQWQAALSNGATAIGISPDDVACWGDNNGSSTGGAPCTGSGSSVWGADGNQTVQWNSGGNQYYCWD